MIKQKSIIYCRVSSERQKTEGHGLDSQEHRCRELSDRKDYEVEKVFRDSFTGGGDFFERPAMSELIGYIDKHPQTSYVVIFDDLKRFARDVSFHWKLKKEFTSRNTKLECLNFTFEDTPEGRFIETILAGQGQLEREQNKRQVLQKMKARLDLGYWCFPATPIGYRFEKDSIHGKLPVPVLKTSMIVKEALEGFASGRFIEQEDVRLFLEEKKLLNNKPIYLSYVRRLLSTVFFAGYIEYEPWGVSRRIGKHEPLIDLITFQKIQERLNTKLRTHTKNILNEDFPLRSFVLCSSCGKPDTASWSSGRNGKFPYYRCKTKGCPERNKSIKKKDIEDKFEIILGKIKPSPEVLNLTKAIIADVWKKREAQGINKKSEIEKEIAKMESEKAKFIKLIPKAINEDVVVAYEGEISSLSKKSLVLKNSLMSFDKHRPNIETVLDIVFDFLKDPLKQWKNGDIHTQKLVLRLVFEENLRYNKKSGFETAILSLPLRVFTLPEAQNGSLVEMAGIEPACKRKS